MLPRYALVLLPLLVAADPAAAQDERILRQEFEGTMVTVRMDMPGTEDGVDVYPGTSAPIDYPKYAQRLKTYGVALRSGQSVMVTKVKVKDDLIEFQLGGGGFGTMFDDSRTTVTATPVAKSKREKDLEKQVRSEPDRDRKRQLQEELDDLRRDREREDRRNEASVAAASEQRRENVRRQREEGGSRFNLRYRGGVPASALSPAAVREALAKYVEFPRGEPGGQSVGVTPATHIRLGMLLPEVEAALGPAVTAEERMEGTLHVSVRTYARPEGRIIAELVEGVVIRFRQSAN